MSITTTQARPFVKWVGGKTQLLPELLKRVPTTFENYYEPFLGGGALFFALQPDVAILSDINEELVNAYDVVMGQVDALICGLRLHKYEEKHYYAVRDLDRDRPAFYQLSKVIRASRFIYLNKTGYNGLYRVNRSGHYNVSFGRYTNPLICDEDNLRACSAVLARPHTFVCHHGFTNIHPGKGDFVYLDPPYAPLTATANFTGYDSDGFGERCQRNLAGWLKIMDRGGVQWMLSNSACPLILDLYKDFHIEFVDAKRSVNSDPTKRGNVKEVIVRNYGGVR